MGEQVYRISYSVCVAAVHNNNLSNGRELIVLCAYPMLALCFHMLPEFPELNSEMYRWMFVPQTWNKGQTY